MENPSSEPRPAVVEVDALSVMQAIRHRLPLIVGMGVLGIVASVGYTYIQPAVFESRASLVLPASQGAGPFQVAGGMGSPVQMYAQILESNTLLEGVAGDMGMEVRAVRQSIEVVPVDRSRIIHIAIRTRDSDRSVRIAEMIFERLRTEDLRLKLALRAELQTTIEEIVLARSEELAAAEGMLQAVRERGYLAAGDAQKLTTGLKERRVELESVMESLEMLRGSLAKSLAGVATLPENVGPSPSLRKELEEAQLQLSLVALRHGDEAPEFVTAKERVAVLEQRLRTQLEGYEQTIQAGVADGQPGSVMQTLTDLTVRATALQTEITALERLVVEYPDQARQVEALASRVETLRGLVASLESRYEIARIEAVNDPNRWEILDAPYALEYPINKRYGRSAMTGLLLGTLFGLALAVSGRGSKA